MAPTLPQPAPSRARTLEAGQGLGRLAQHRAASRPGLCAIAPGRRAGAPPVWKLTRSFPVQACKHPPAASLFSPALRALGSKPGTKVTARSSLIMGWFPCAVAVLGSPNPQGKPAQHIHLPLGGRTAPGKARSGRDRKSTRLNSSHQLISYAVFCLKKKKTPHELPRHNIVNKDKTIEHNRPHLH